ncbi:TOBE domain-containing protein [Dietzia aurantiaca]|uniref:TOBE domain-containing protein n=1 Tax=Dietzia aurantiaca TaxID=983873 RepID=UPI001E38267A|nr:TOBE domain-containing protein [Dietzia aurantiaca]MCD2261234.1 TOBE domain-containing protein [Dietzia aurantiaca]
MTQLRISEAASLMGVSDDTVRRWIDRGELTASPDDSGRKTVAGTDLARLAQERAAGRSAGVDGSGDTAVSARNSFRGLVTSVRSDEVMSQVDIQCGPYRVVSLISTEAVREMGLEPGSLATARVKATSVVIEGAPQ